MPNVRPLHATESAPLPAPYLEQERARAALFALRDLLEAVPPAAGIDPGGLGALLGLLGESLPDMDGA